MFSQEYWSVGVFREEFFARRRLTPREDIAGIAVWRVRTLVVKGGITEYLRENKVQI